LVECLRLGVGHASPVRPDPSTLGVVGERGSHHEAACRPVPGNDGDWLTRYGRPMTLTGWAAGYAEELLAPLGDRWAHVEGVVSQAQEVAAILPTDEREVLVAAAYLHDLGYAPALVETDLHALDGPVISAASGMSGWLGWSRTTPALGVKPSCAGWPQSWPSSRMRPRPRRWRSPTLT
jgi:hypothetical protein